MNLTEAKDDSKWKWAKDTMENELNTAEDKDKERVIGAKHFSDQMKVSIFKQ